MKLTNDFLLDYLLSALRSGKAEVTEKRIVTDCPNCSKENHFSVRPVGWYICYRCGLKGKLEVGSRWLEWVSQIRLSLRDTSGGIRRTSGGTRADRVATDILRVPVVAPEAPRAAWNYLAGRGLDRETARRYRVEAEFWGHRVWFPYWVDGGRVFEMGRTIIPGLTPKTVEPIQSSKPLYGIHVGLPFGKDVFCVEGVFDHFATPCSVALMGSDLYENQVCELQKLGRRVYLLFDPDARHKCRAKALVLRRRGLDACALLLEGTSRDPADLGESVMRKIVSSVRASTGSLPRLPAELTLQIAGVC